MKQPQLSHSARCPSYQGTLAHSSQAWCTLHFLMTAKPTQVNTDQERVLCATVKGLLSTQQTVIRPAAAWRQPITMITPPCLVQCAAATYESYHPMNHRAHCWPTCARRAWVHSPPCVVCNLGRRSGSEAKNIPKNKPHRSAAAIRSGRCSRSGWRHTGRDSAGRRRSQPLHRPCCRANPASL